jgi:tetratricopeptide (TPR) repeat protein
LIPWVREIEPLLPDIRGSLDWGLGREPVSAAQAICRMRWLWWHGSEHRTWLERALANRSSLTDAVLADVLSSVGWARLVANDPVGAAEPLRESIELFNRLGDEVDSGSATMGYAWVLSARGADSDALALLEELLAGYRDIGYERAICNVLTNIGALLRKLGDHEGARARLTEAIALAEVRDDSVLLSGALVNLGDVALERGELDDAAELFECALSLARQVGAPRDVAWCLAGLACVAALGGDSRRAGELWGQAEFVVAETGERHLLWEGERYESIVASVKTDDAFGSGYDAGRAAEAASFGSPAALAVTVQ